MKNIKDITISIFAIIGFVAILSSFNNQSQETHSTVPESHIWSFHTINPSGMGGQGANAFSMNKVTGEVRRYDAETNAHIRIDPKNTKKEIWVKNPRFAEYVVSTSSDN
jgi:hypothetical protein